MAKADFMQLQGQHNIKVPVIVLYFEAHFWFL